MIVCPNKPYFTKQYNIFTMLHQVNPDIHMLNIKHKNYIYQRILCDIHVNDETVLESLYIHVSKYEKLFNAVENTGTENLYWCVNCSNCSKCKNGDTIEAISVNEEVEKEFN